VSSSTLPALAKAFMALPRREDDLLRAGAVMVQIGKPRIVERGREPSWPPSKQVDRSTIPSAH
jgi:hypothetical protein